MTLEDKIDLLLVRLDKLESVLVQPPKEWFSVAEVCQMTGVSDDHIRRAIATGHLAASNVGGPGRPYYRLTKKDVETWMEKRKGGVSHAAKKPLPVSPHFTKAFRKT